MEMLPALWSAAVRRVVYTVIDAATGVLAVYMAWLGIKGVLRTWNDESVTLFMTDAVLYAALPVGAALWALRLFLRVAGRWQPCSMAGQAWSTRSCVHPGSESHSTGVQRATPCCGDAGDSATRNGAHPASIKASAAAGSHRNSEILDTNPLHVTSRPATCSVARKF
jgi:hypothetical protein